MTTSITDELSAMRKIAAAVQPLDEEAQRRVIRYLFDRYVVKTAPKEETATNG